jgi:hypothetical protein
MSKIKDTVRGGANNAELGWRAWARSGATRLVTQGLEWGKWAYMSSRFIGWIIVTTGIVTALPLIFEVPSETSSFIFFLAVNIRATCRSRESWQ